MSENAPVPAVRQSLYRPIWADPGFIGSINDFQITRLAFPNAGIFKLALNNPKRWLLAFTADAGIVISPNARPDIVPFITLTTGVPFPVRTFEYGPLSCSEWYVSIPFAPAVPINVTVTEVEVS